MKKFTYRFENLLKMRLDQEDKVKLDLSKALQVKEDLLREKDSLHQRSLAYEKESQELLKKGVPGASLAIIYKNRSYYVKAMSAVDSKINQQEAKIKALREALMEARKEVKIMETLKEKEYEAFLEKVEEEDRKLIDQVVSYQYSTKDGED